MSAEQEEYLAVLKASYDYEPQSEDEIEIKEDQLLLLIERTDDEYVLLFLCGVYGVCGHGCGCVMFWSTLQLVIEAVGSPTVGGASAMCMTTSHARPTSGHARC